MKVGARYWISCFNWHQHLVKENDWLKRRLRIGCVGKWVREERYSDSRIPWCQAVPTVCYWQDPFGPIWPKSWGLYRHWMGSRCSRAAHGSTPLSLFLHLPGCPRICKDWLLWDVPVDWAHLPPLSILHPHQIPGSTKTWLDLRGIRHSYSKKDGNSLQSSLTPGTQGPSPHWLGFRAIGTLIHCRLECKIQECWKLVGGSSSSTVPRLS